MVTLFSVTLDGRSTTSMTNIHKNATVNTTVLLVMPLFIRLKARLQPNAGFAFKRTLAVFMRLDITPPKENRFT